MEYEDLTEIVDKLDYVRKTLSPEQLRWTEVYFFNGGNGSSASRAVLAEEKSENDEDKPETAIKAHAHRQLDNPNISKYISLLKIQVSDRTLMSVFERKSILAEMARTRHSQFVNDGNNGIDINKENLSSPGIKKVKTSIRGQDSEVVRELEIHNPIDEIKALNDMDGIGGRGMAVTAKTGKNGVTEIRVEVSAQEEKLSDEVLAFKAKHCPDA